MKFNEWKLTTLFLIGMSGGDTTDAERYFNFTCYYQQGWGCMETAREYLHIMAPEEATTCTEKS